MKHVRPFILAVATLALSALAPLALAAGGNGADRGGGLGLKRGEKVFLADTFDLTSGGLVQVKGPASRIEQYVLKSLKAARPAEGAAIAKILSKMTFEDVDHLPLVGDDHYSCEGCEKVQIAEQSLLPADDQRPIRRVKALYDRLSPLDQAMLRIHEAYVRARFSPGDTKPVRMLVSVLTAMMVLEDNWTRIASGQAGIATKSHSVALMAFVLFARVPWQKLDPKALNPALEGFTFSDFLSARPATAIGDRRLRVKYSALLTSMMGQAYGIYVDPNDVLDAVENAEDGRAMSAAIARKAEFPSSGR